MLLQTAALLPLTCGLVQAQAALGTPGQQTLAVGRTPGKGGACAALDCKTPASGRGLGQVCVRFFTGH